MNNRMVRKVKDGAGAGYTIKGYVSDLKVNSITPTEIKLSYPSIICDCDIDAVAEITNASSYYEGADINEETPCKITRIEVFLNFGYSNSQDSDILDIFNVEEDIEYADEFTELVENFNVANINIDALSEYVEYYGSEDFETLIGAGWVHHTFDGTIINERTDNKTDGGEVDIIDAHITDEKMISFIDKVVTGETSFSEYEIYINDEVAEEYDVFEDESEAIKVAEQIAEEQDVFVQVMRKDFQESFNGDLDLYYDEIVWDSNPDVDEWNDEDDY